MNRGRSSLPLAFTLLAGVFVSCSDQEGVADQGVDTQAACPSTPDPKGGALYKLSTFTDVGGRNEDLAFDGNGNAYVSLTRLGKIVKVTAGGTKTDFAGGLKAPSGVAVGPKGNVHVCEWGTTSGGGKLSRITPMGKVTSVSATGTKKFFNPNHLAISSQGIIYMSDSSGFVARIQGVSATVLFDAKKQAPSASPNGLALSRDERTLYVNDLYAPKGLWLITLDSQGEFVKAQAAPLSESLMLADGIALDCRGHLYITYALSRIATVDPSTWKVQTIYSGMALATPANVAFGYGPGLDLRSIYIAQLGLSSAVTTIQKMNVGIPGMPLPGTPTK